MIEVKVESIRVSLINQQRLVVLREVESSRYLPIWIGAFEAEAITFGLQEEEVERPLTHDLLRDTIEQLGADLEHIVVNKLEEDTFFASIVLDRDDERIEVDARPSDAIALAVRADVPIFVEDEVMDKAGQMPATGEEEDEEGGAPEEGDAPRGSADDLGVFREFIEGLDMGSSSGEGED